MKELPHEIELQHLLDVTKECFPTIVIPPLYMWIFMEDYKKYGKASRCEEIYLSMPAIGDFKCDNQQFVRTVIHEIVHLNYWEDGHNQHFWIMDGKIFDRVWNKLQEKKGESK